MGRAFRTATLVFLILGTALLAATRQNAIVWFSATGNMTNTVAIMVAMQLFTIPVTMGAYDELIRRWAEKRFSSGRTLFLFSTLVTHIMTSFLMLGAVPLSISLLESTLRSRIKSFNRFLSVVVSRGYVLAALWAPGAINLYLVVQAVGVPWSSILLPGMVLAFLSLGIAFGVETLPGGILIEAGGPFFGAGTENSFSENPKPKVTGPKVFHVPLAATTVAIGVLIMEKFNFAAGYTRIMLSGCIVAVVWTAFLLRQKGLRRSVETYWSVELLKVKDMGPFFVAMGLFSVALEASGTLHLVQPFLNSAVSALGSWAVLVFPFTIVILSLFGLHPFITIVLFGKILANAALPLPPLTVALSIATGGAAAYMISPFAGVIMSIAGFTGAKASDIALRWNGKFGIFFLFFGILFSFLWGKYF